MHQDMMIPLIVDGHHLDIVQFAVINEYEDIWPLFGGTEIVASRFTALRVWFVRSFMMYMCFRLYCTCVCYSVYKICGSAGDYTSADLGSLP